MRRGLAATVRGEAPKAWGRMGEMFMALGPVPSHADVVAMNRSLNLLG